MRVLLDILLHQFSREEISEGVMWFLRLAGACYLQAGLLKLAQENDFGWTLVGAGIGFIVISTVKFYIVRLLAISGWTVFLIFVFFVRQNPFSIFFAVIGIFHIYKMLRYWKATVENI